jgi:hypothetical protein
MQYAIFEGLVVDEANQVASVAYIGDVPHYVVDDAGFLRHIPASKVDLQVVGAMQEGVLQNKEAVVAECCNIWARMTFLRKARLKRRLPKWTAM